MLHSQCSLFFKIVAILLFTLPVTVQLEHDEFLFHSATSIQVL
jgi:hypothetical protein